MPKLITTRTRIADQGKQPITITEGVRVIEALLGRVNAKINGIRK